MTDDNTESDATRDAQPAHPDVDENQTTPTAGDGGAGTEGGPTTTGGVETGPAGEGQPQESASGGRSTGARLAWLVQIAGLVILCLLALVATFRVYFAASTAISVWISPDFVSVFQVAFNLLVLILSIYGISVLVRRLS